MSKPLDGTSVILRLRKAPVFSEFVINGRLYFRIDEEQYKVYPPGTTDIDDGAYFVTLPELVDEFGGSTTLYDFEKTV